MTFPYEGLYALASATHASFAIDLILDFYDTAFEARDYAAVAEVMTTVDLSRLPSAGFIYPLYGFAHTVRDKIPGYTAFLDRAEARYRELGLSDDRIHDLLDDHRKSYTPAQPEIEAALRVLFNHRDD